MGKIVRADGAEQRDLRVLLGSRNGGFVEFAFDNRDVRRELVRYDRRTFSACHHALLPSVRSRAMCIRHEPVH
jgi:hypothetical protein